jgi:gamma-glutamyltranspeptidase/glutathione hydrolase
VLRDGEPWLAYGTPGDDRQEQWALHTLLRHVDRGLDLQAAVDAPEWHTLHLVASFAPRGIEPRSLYVESRFGEEVIAELRRRGHDVTVTGPWELGRTSAVRRDGGLLAAAATTRATGSAVCR